MNPPTVRDLVDFILLNRGTTTFMGFSEERILSMVMEGIEANSMFYSVDSSNRINGMILAIIDPEHKIVFVTENLSMTITNLKAFAKRAKLTWPDYQLQAIRHGSHRKFDTEKLYHKLN